MTDTNLADPPADETPIAGDPSPDLPTPVEAPSEPAPQGPRMVPVDVLVREVTPLRAKNRELESALDEHRRRLSEANQLIERFQRAPNGADPGTAPAPAPRPTGYSDQDIEWLAAKQVFQRDAQAVRDAGIVKYGDKWDGYVNILGSVDLNNQEFVQSIMDIAGRDKAHEIVQEIVQDPMAASALAKLSPRRRIAEITRMVDRMNTKASPAAPVAAAPATQPAKNVSKAPPPAPRVDASAGQIVDWRSDKASDDEFSKGWNERYLRRGDAIRR